MGRSDERDRPRVSIDDTAARQQRARENTFASDQTRYDASDINGRYAQALKEEANATSNSKSDRHELAQPTDMLRPSVLEGQAADGLATEVSSSDADTEFDWDESDDSELDEAEREEKKRKKLEEKREEHQHHVKRAKRLRKAYLAFMRLARPIRTALLLTIGSGIAIIPAIVIWLRFPNASQAIRANVIVWSVWATIAWGAACVTTVVVDVMPHLIIKLILLVYGSTPENAKTQVDLWMGVRLYTKIALGLTWDWVAIVVILRFFSVERDAGQLNYFTWVIRANAALFGTGLVLLVEKVLLQMIKINFHRTALQSRLEENAKALWALDKLAAAKDIRHTPKRRSGMFAAFTSSRRASLEGAGGKTPARNTSGRNTSGRNTPGKPMGDEPVLVEMPLTPAANGNGHQMEEERKKGLFRRRSNGPAEAPDRDDIVNGGASGSGSGNGVVPEDLEKELRKAARKKGHKKPQHSRTTSANMFNAAHLADQLTNALANATLKNGTMKGKDGFGSTHSAKKLARKLFEGLDEDRGGALNKSEFEPFFRNASDAAQAFALFDRDGNGDIDRKEMRNAVSRIYRERKALATSMKDMSSAVAKLDGVLLTLAAVIAVFIWLFIFNPDGTTAQLVPMATIILGFSFLFGNSAKNLFESMIFIFSVHPYDVGDLIFVDDQPMIVTAFGLFATTFTRVDGQVLVAPNSVLASQKYILNVRRSGSMWETTKVQLAFDTPLETLNEFRTLMRAYVTENSREWGGGLDVNFDYMENQNLIQLVVAMQHKGNWQDWGGRWSRRTALMKHMKGVLHNLNVTYRLPVQPVTFHPKGGRPPVRPGGQGSNPSLSGSARRQDSVAFGNAGRMGTNAGEPFLNTTGQLPTLRVDTQQTFRSNR